MSMIIEPIFKNFVLQDIFDKNGFVKINLLEKEDLYLLSQLQEEYNQGDLNYFFASSYLNDYNKKIEISNRIQEIILPRLEKYFTNYRSFGSSFLVKGTGKNSEMPMHQDWTIVDENKYPAINIWTPLIATNETNGTLELLAGSHNWNKTIRAPTLPFYFDRYKEQIKTKLTIVNTKAGEAIVINQATIHYSKPNLTAKNRVAITTGITNKNAPLRFYYWNKETPDKIERFKQKDDFLLSFTDFHESIFKRPIIGISEGLEDFNPPTITPEEVSSYLNHISSGSLPKNKRSLKNWFKKLAK
ncbi:MAG: phytanoyl-CoA dioxygenase family protein [Flavobacteriales bacterium]|nr:phytanoyl-CoA dioxygenase family protein [Flavobacteriales bacterium]